MSDGGAKIVKRTLSALDRRIAALEGEIEAYQREDVDSSELEPAMKRRVPPAEPLPLHCDVCGVSVNSATLMQEHRVGKRHREAVIRREAVGEGRWCDVCSLAFTSSVQLSEHEQGKRHKLAMARRSGPAHPRAGR